MAIEPRYTEQMPFVGTPTQRLRIEQEATKRRTSLADVVRRAVDGYFGLVNGEEPEAKESETTSDEG